jgi:hypothetical protein
VERKGEAKMNANGFREDELVSRRVKVGNEWETRIFPIVAGRLRLAHEENDALSLKTEMVSWDGQYAVFKCNAATGKGQFMGYGTANAQRDSRLAESLVELAETRSIARALRFAGYGLEFCGAEEITAITDGEQNSERIGNKAPERVFPQDNGGNKPTATAHDAAPGKGKAESKPQHCGNGQATTAQVRALFALTKRAQYSEEDIQSLLLPLEVSAFQDLSREDASRLITYLQTEVAA